LKYEPRGRKNGKGRAEILVKKYIKKEDLLKGDVEILDVEEVPIDQARVLGLVVD